MPEKLNEKAHVWKSLFSERRTATPEQQQKTSLNEMNLGVRILRARCTRVCVATHK